MQKKSDVLMTSLSGLFSILLHIRKFMRLESWEALLVLSFTCKFLFCFPGECEGQVYRDHGSSCSFGNRPQKK